MYAFSIALVELHDDCECHIEKDMLTIIVSFMFGTNEEGHDISESRLSISRSIFEPGTSRIRNVSANH
jgi:hypothetical protein